MAKLCQIVAVSNGKRNEATSRLTNLYKGLQKDAEFFGFTRVYSPIDDEGIVFPPESKNICSDVKGFVTAAKGVIADLIDVVATQDYGNVKASADIKIGDKVLAKDVPVPHLLFLEARLKDVRTFISHIPVLTAGENWTYDPGEEVYKTDTEKTLKTKKTLKSHVLIAPTPEHPGQAESYNEDVPIGHWNTTKLSTAIPQSEKRKLLDRVDKLLEAVKFAREEANSTEVDQIKIGKKLLDYVFDDA